MNFDWNPNGRCSTCNRSGITISILLYKYLIPNLYPTSKSDIEYECHLCDYEGKCYYDENNVILNDFACCDNCSTEITEYCIKRGKGITQEWSENGYNGICLRCNLRHPVEGLSLCNHHMDLIK